MAKLLVLVALVCYTVVSVSCNRAFFKRAEALHQRKRQAVGDFKACCLPAEFTLKADAVVTTGYFKYKSESKAKIELAYSNKDGSLYLSGSSDDMPAMSAVFGITADEVTMKVAMGTCEYIDYVKFSDNYVMKYVQGQICIPSEISNYEGQEKMGDLDVEVYNIYSLNVTTLFPSEDTMQVSLKMRALRREDDSCIPIQFEGTNNYGPMNSFMSLELQSLDISDSVDSTKFESAC